MQHSFEVELGIQGGITTQGDVDTVESLLEDTLDDYDCAYQIDASLAQPQELEDATFDITVHHDQDDTEAFEEEVVGDLRLTTHKYRLQH